MSTEISEEFKQYAMFSVRADRFFSMVNIYGMNHDKLKFVYKSLPSREKAQEAIDREDLDQSVRDYILISRMNLEYMAKTTGIFTDDEHAIDNSDMWQDAINYSFYTCFSFQWSLFESFVKNILRKAINANVFPEAVRRNLDDRWKRTEALLKYIHSGAVFGKSPFNTVLPVVGWTLKTKEITYSDLDKIRRQRNDFIHLGLEAPGISTEKIGFHQQNYEHVMWILRHFAENIEFEVQRLLDAKKSS